MYRSDKVGFLLCGISCALLCGMQQNDYINRLSYDIKKELVHATLARIQKENEDRCAPLRQLVVFSRISKSWHVLIVTMRPNAQFMVTRQELDRCVFRKKVKQKTVGDQLKYKQIQKLFTDTDSPALVMSKLWMGGIQNNYYRFALDLILKKDPSLCQSLYTAYSRITTGLWVIRVKTITFELNGLHYERK